MRALPLTSFFIFIFTMVMFTISITQYGGIAQPGAGFMPTIVSGLLLLFSAIDSVIDFKTYRKNLNDLSIMDFRAVALIVVVVMLFVFMLETLGFIICAFLLQFSFMKIRGVRLLMAMVVSVVTPIVIYFVFAKILLVALPSGVLL